MAKFFLRKNNSIFTSKLVHLNLRNCPCFVKYNISLYDNFKSLFMDEKAILIHHFIVLLGMKK